MISQPVPAFSLPAVSAGASQARHVSLSDCAGRWLLLLFYPRDFSFVCPTELTSFSARAIDFERRNCRILGISVDTVESHAEWLNTPPAAGGLGPLQFPLASDIGGDVARQFGIWMPVEGVCARGLFLIDPQGVLQYSVVHSLSVGRSVDEILRVLDALETGGLCPASWTSADGTIDAEQALQPGRVLGHYKIRRLLGKGSFGSVFAAWDLQLERNVALKVLNRKAAESREETLREARAAASLNHPNVCTIYAVEEIDGLPVIALEYIDGRPLSLVVADSQSDEQKLQMAHGIVLGLSAAHARQIVHGDLKPANILVDRNNVPRILDFGLARKVRVVRDGVDEAPGASPPIPVVVSAAGDSESTTEMQVPEPLRNAPGASAGISGTPAYMAPEQWTGSPASPASDVFAFGLVFFEMLTGRRALPETSPLVLAMQAQNPQISRLLSQQLPERFHDLILATLHRDPTSRPTAERIAPRLRALMAQPGKR